MGVRLLATTQLAQEEIELASGIPGDLGELVMHVLDDLPETLFDLIGSSSGRLQESDRASEGGCYRVQEVSDDRAPGAPLQDG
uniref:hypothetical protein n=1 Tax=Pseudomonas sp. S-47 TaxID=115714 RepID=UPI0015E870B3|nr:hypothetical protein [Pseudomonas sp. S-47]